MKLCIGALAFALMIPISGCSASISLPYKLSCHSLWNFNGVQPSCFLKRLI